MAIAPSKDFSDIDRTFFQVDGKNPFKADEIEAWAYWGGSTRWPEILKLRRVVILAEANSGKTQEFRNQVRLINGAGGFAFFIAIESLARNALSKALGPDQFAKFNEWQSLATDGHFFLDSLDEAKLNDLSFQDALRTLGEAIAGAHKRVHLIISSRGTDWDGEEDLSEILECLPVESEKSEDDNASEDEALISVLRKEENPKDKNRKLDVPVTVFAMARLSPEQRSKFLRCKGLTDISKFEAALFRRGLTPMAERPGDLAMLFAYWSSAGRFGALRQMMEFSMQHRLSERENRRDASILTDPEARIGAERIAAAMTLGRKLTILSQRTNEPADDAVDPAKVLSDWPANKRKALLRRGIFAPSTYGRIRFHHRSAVEYLTASWLKRILGGPRFPSQAVYDLFVGKGYDVQTVPPSLRPAAAWLALGFPRLRDFITDTDPLVLLAYGDPSGLPIAVREQLLAAYAAKDAKGVVADLRIDAHALWMFADPKLSDALQNAWNANPHEDFRFELLRLIELGALDKCRDLVRAEALNKHARRENRILAARALREIGDLEGQQRLAKDLLKNASKYSARLAPELAISVFPEALSVKQLLSVIARSPAAGDYQVEGFGYALEELFLACLNVDQRNTLTAGLAKLGEQMPLDEYHHVSERHASLLKHLAPMLRQAIVKSDQDGVTDGLVSLLSIAGRSDVDESLERGTLLRDLVTSRPTLNRRLFWEDATREFSSDGNAAAHPFVWWFHTPGRRFWKLDADDLPWLIEDVLIEAELPKQRLAFSAVYALSRDAGRAIADIERRFSSYPLLLADLEDFQRPAAPESDVQRRFRLRSEATDAARHLQFERDVIALRERRELLRADLGKLDDSQRILEWPGAIYLYDLTRWLAKKAATPFLSASKEHRKLITAYGSDIQQAYQRGMKTIWRGTTPGRPTFTPDGQMSMLKTEQLAVAGVNLESTVEGWVGALASNIAKRAIEHAIFTGRDAPEWLEKFCQVAPPEALDVITGELQLEWAAPSSQAAPFLSRFQHAISAPPYIKRVLFDLLMTVEVQDPGRVHGLNYLIARLDLTDGERASLAGVVRARLDSYRRADAWEWSASYIGVYFNLNMAEATAILPLLLDEQPDEVRYNRAIGLIGSLFSMSSGIVTTLGTATPAVLEELLLIAYRLVSPKHDQIREGVFSSDDRDDAQDARGRILTALINLKSAEAYQTVLKLASHPGIEGRGRRFKQIAAGMAEDASEKPSWTESDVQRFELESLGPVRTSQELLMLATAIVDDIENEFKRWDFSMQELIATAKDEFAIQNWLGREFERAARGRYSTAREKEVKSEKKPDLTLTAANGGDEIAIEVKHGEKNWTLLGLEEGISRQLAQDYLRPTKRRAGLFIVTNHRETRFWYSKDKKKRLSFAEAVEHLSEFADGIKSNADGFISLAVRGLDAAGIPRPRKGMKKEKRVKRASSRKKTIGSKARRPKKVSGKRAPAVKA